MGIFVRVLVGVLGTTEKRTKIEMHIKWKKDDTAVSSFNLVLFLDIRNDEATVISSLQKHPSCISVTPVIFVKELFPELGENNPRILV